MSPRLSGALIGLFTAFAATHANAKSVSPVLPPFHAIRITGMTRISYTQAATQSVTLTGSPAVLKAARLRVERGVLVLGLKAGTVSADQRGLTLTVAAAPLDRLDVSGMASGTLKGLSGPDFTLRVGGTGRLTLSGTVTTVRVALSGAGKVDATHLRAEDLSVTISGTGSVDGYARNAAHIDISGVGSATIAGHPPTRSVSKRGVGSVVFE